MKKLIAFASLTFTILNVQAKPVNLCHEKADGLFTIALAKEVGVTETQALQVAGRAVTNQDLRTNYINGIKMIYENPIFKNTTADQIKDLTLKSCSR